MASNASITRRHALKVFPALATATLPAAMTVDMDEATRQDPVDTLVHHLQMVVKLMNEATTGPTTAYSSIEEIEARWPASSEGDFEASEDFHRWEELVARQQGI